MFFAFEKSKAKVIVCFFARKI